MNSQVRVGIRWRWIALYLGVWTVLALVSAAETYVAMPLHGKPVPASLALERAFEEWYLWALLSLGIITLGERFPFRAGPSHRWCLLHGAASAATSVVYVALYASLLQGQYSIEGQRFTFGSVFQKVVLSYFLFNTSVYWLVLLAQQGWYHFQQSRRRELQAAALATELVQARLETLRMQINPHFLFNTLNTISALIHEQPDAADRMIARLSELLRRTLDRSDVQEVPLREEIGFLRGYLEIEQMRFPDRLTVQISVDPQAWDLLVPHLILQPLVENALRHGILPREEPGRVEICARVASPPALELTVRDDGAGLPSADAAPERTGIGLQNVRSRLKHLYGAAQSFHVRNAPGGGVEARLRLPCRTAPAPVARPASAASAPAFAADA